MKFAKLLFPCWMVLACSGALQANDQVGMAYLYGYGGYGGYAGGLRSYTPAPPYFALHPPVYYGQRYTRPYGVSPFAAWPQLQTNAAYAPQPQAVHAQTICNPYCSPEAIVAPLHEVSQVKAVEPLEIENPYYEAAVRYTASDNRP